MEDKDQNKQMGKMELEERVILGKIKTNLY